MKNNPRRIFLFSLIFLAVWVFTLSLIFFSPGPSRAGEKDKPQYTIKWATIAPENTVWGETVHSATDEVEKLSGGRLKNIWYFGAVMGDEPDTIRKLKLNQLQGLALLSVGLSKLAPELVAYSLPYLFQDYEEVDCVFDKSWPLVEKVLNQRGYEVFGRTDVGFSVFFSKNNLHDAADWKKAKTWTWVGLEVDKAAALMFGIENLIPLALPEVLPALQTGMVDTAYATYYTSIALQWNTEIKYMSDARKHGGAFAPAMLVLKKKTYDSLPPDIQKIMKDTFRDAFPSLRAALRRDEHQAEQALLDRGIKYMDVDPEFMKEVKSRIPAVYDDWKGKYYPDWFIDGILQARDECRSESKK